MITSPSAITVSTASKNVRSSNAISNSQESFSSTLEQVTSSPRASQTSASAPDNTVESNKNQENQYTESATDERVTASTDLEADTSTEQVDEDVKAISNEDNADKITSESTLQDEMGLKEEVVVTNNGSVDESNVIDPSEQPLLGGKERQVSGQELAVEAPIQATNPEDSLTQDNKAASLDKALSQEQLLDDVDRTVEELTDSLENDEQSDTNQQLEQVFVSLDASPSINQQNINGELGVSSTPLEGETSGISVSISGSSSPQALNASASTLEHGVAEVPRNLDITNLGNAASSLMGVENTSSEIKATTESTLNVTLTASSDGSRIAASQVSMNDVRQSSLEASSTQTTTERSLEGLSKANLETLNRSVETAAVEGDEVGDVETSDNNNLRWIMEQMSKQATASKTSEAAGLNVSLDDTSAEQSTLLDVDVDLLQEVPNDELLNQEMDELISDRKTFEQIMSNLGSVSQQGTQSFGLQSAQSNPATMRGDSAAAQLTMQSLPDAQAFPSEMATKVSWVAKEGFKTAHIQLDPPELGSLTVKVSVDQDSNTHVSFVASSAQAKDALEGQMQRLREMLQQQGVQLDSVDVEVSQGNDQAFGSNGSEGNGQSSNSFAGLGDSDVGDEEIENVSYVSSPEQGIDYYA
ncbi:flagellar hook-length control protein FliK [Marinomonas ostreistagni]|uniref:Flagellar hook-length control protein FliK n=1 Tax=Marinomonas ostreistagni TaxID=359209 RepID=A0ABS0Z8B3_9GAMM|nr:flagellar hook-length control protein FliK [Marinomonas ostreistagni]MBJ7549246.1 flagellar hook-length control protein FliK [Marinomonas ostreistagni]